MCGSAHDRGLDDRRCQSICITHAYCFRAPQPGLRRGRRRPPAGGLRQRRRAPARDPAQGRLQRRARRSSSFPAVVGRRQDDAHRIVERAGLKLRWLGFVGKLGNGRYEISCVKVLSQSPVAGERRPRGASVAVIEAACHTPDQAPTRRHAGRRSPGRPMTSDERTANLLGALALTLADRAGAAVHAGAGVSGSDAAALVTLRNYAEGEPLDLLRRALALSQPGVVRLADRLQARGLVERHRGARDGRAVGLRLTPRGPARRRRRARRARRRHRRGPEALDAGERRALGPMLERMLGAETTDATASLVICRMCDPDVCGHPDRCPVTQAARAIA